MLAIQTKYQIIFFNSFPFDWYVIPLLLLGALSSPQHPFQLVDNEKTRKNPEFTCPNTVIGCNTCPEASTSGFLHSPGPPPLGTALGIIPVLHHGQQNSQQVWCFYCRFFCSWSHHPQGRYGANIWPMMASSGFEWSLNPLHQLV